MHGPDKCAEMCFKPFIYHKGRADVQQWPVSRWFCITTAKNDVRTGLAKCLTLEEMITLSLSEAFAGAVANVGNDCPCSDDLFVQRLCHNRRRVNQFT